MLNKFICFIFILFSSFSYAESKSFHVLVSVAPYKYLVEHIAEGSLTVDLMVPAAASAHTFEPTPKQMIAASQADVWFQIGESFEKKASQAILGHNPEIRFVDLREGVNLIYATDPNHQGCPHCKGGADLHFWLSPQIVEHQVKLIANALIALYPEFQDKFRLAADKLVQELVQLDQEIRKTVAPVKQRVIMVSHPAYAYFCRDYNFKQMSIEFEGKDPTPQQLTQLLERARQVNIHVIYVQKQYSSKGAKLVAQDLGAEVVMLDPYAEDYFHSLREIAEKLASQ